MRFKNWLNLWEAQQFSVSNFLTQNGIQVGPDAQAALTMSQDGKHIFVRNRQTGKSLSVPIASGDNSAFEAAKKNMLNLFGRQPNQQQPNNNQQQSNQQQQPNQQSNNVQIPDPTNTEYGKFFARYMSEKFKMAQQENSQDPFGTFFAKNGFPAEMYEDIHVDDPQKAQAAYNSIMSGLLKKYNTNDIDDLDKLLFQHISSLDGKINPKFKFSKSMSASQGDAMIWFRAGDQVPIIGDADSEAKQRVYINLNPIYYEEGIKWITDVMGDFYTKNPQLEPYVYIKFKVRGQTVETNRADTCIVYINVRKGVDPAMAQKIIQGLTTKLSQIPQQYITGLSAPLLSKKANGVTTVDDNVKTDPGESYTTQLKSSYRNAVMSMKANPPKDMNNFIKAAQNIITQTVNDLKNRKYPVV